MASMPWILTAFGMGMTMFLLWGGFLGIINGYNGWAWVLALMTGIVVITLLGLLHDEMGVDEYEPRRTFTTTSNRIIHIERPRRHFDEEDD